MYAHTRAHNNVNVTAIPKSMLELNKLEPPETNRLSLIMSPSDCLPPGRRNCPISGSGQGKVGRTERARLFIFIASALTHTIISAAMGTNV